MKIKTFEFCVSVHTGNSCKVNSGICDDMSNSFEKYVKTPDMIDEKINSFIKDLDVVSINIENYTLNRHNNGYFDTVIAKYTIIYNEKKNVKKKGA